ncbi:hypothetical protein ACJBU6_03633 [Exserohilum turcicum]
MELHYGRKFDWDMDHVYTPAGIDEVGEGSKRRLYMFLDVNKQLRPSPIPLRCVKVVNKDILLFEDANFNGVRIFSNYYPWGGVVTDLVAQTMSSSNMSRRLQGTEARDLHARRTEIGNFWRNGI